MKLGEANVGALARRLTAKQFMTWVAYSELEPFDEVRADIRAAQVATMIFNMAVAVKDRKQIGDFLLKFGEKVKVEPQQDQFAVMKIIALAQAAAAVENEQAKQNISPDVQEQLEKARAAMKG